MAYIKKISDQNLIEAYNKLKSVWKVAKLYNMCGQSVHERLVKLNLIESKKWKKHEIENLKILYKELNGNINEISKILTNRTYAAIACQANELKLTKRSRTHNQETEKRKQANLNHSKFMKYNHPKGILNKYHTDNTKLQMSIKRKGKKLSEETKQKISDANAGKIKNYNTYSRCQRGYYSINNKIFFFRSSWEAIYANYLTILLKLNIIQKWEYESETFWFEKIKRGVRSYTPDFKIFYSNGNIEYHEVKGWMDNKSKTKIKRMKLYYPEINMIVIDENALNTLRRKYDISNIKLVEKDDNI